MELAAAAMDDSLISFPCDLPVKVFGRNDPAFRGAALAIVRRHFESFDEELRLSERTSRGDRYLSLTVTVRAESRAQMDALYRELTASEDVLMVL
jgi:putative lipoic acid-binding regulatory protein